MNGNRQCTAHRRGTKDRCKKWALPGFTVCELHGGKTPVGKASPLFKNGRHSKHMPTRLVEGFEASLSDPDKLALDSELAVLDTRIDDVLSRVDSGEAGRNWSQMRTSWKAVEDARRSGVPADLVAAMREHGESISRGYADWMAWSDVLDLIERRRRIVDSERKRLVAAQKLISADQALAMMGLLVDVVHKHVRDNDALYAITKEYRRIVAGPSAPVDAESSVRE